ncbi:MAG TPA: sucrase ferredoxin [Mycobacteriales bacterium]|nr:sucrase ferredoxin [Mycobacteriales bacterium]
MVAVHAADDGVGRGRAGETRVGCSTLARRLGESLAGTAPARTDRWLLVEHPGPWPLAPLERITGPGRDVLTRAERLGIRVQLLRRPARRRRASPHQVYVAHTSGVAPWVEGRELADLAELAALDLDALAAGRSPGFGEPVGGPLYLVCTHGRRDACCAEFGRPVAAAVARLFADRVWETTHLGGDRFAANMVCFPHALYSGRLDPVSGPVVAEAYARGEIVLAQYRGRAGTPEVVQVAEHHVRRYLGALSAVGVELESQTTDGSRTTVVLRAAHRRVRVVVETGEAGQRRALTCRAADETCPPVRRVVELTELTDSPPAARLAASPRFTAVSRT